MTERWKAVQGVGTDAWQARIEPMPGQVMVERVTCKHRHRTQDAAAKCAERMAGQAERVSL